MPPLDIGLPHLDSGATNKSTITKNYCDSGS